MAREVMLTTFEELMGVPAEVSIEDGNGEIQGEAWSVSDCGEPGSRKGKPLSIAEKIKLMEEIESQRGTIVLPEPYGSDEDASGGLEAPSERPLTIAEQIVLKEREEAAKANAGIVPQVRQESVAEGGERTDRLDSRFDAQSRHQVSHRPITELYDDDMMQELDPGYIAVPKTTSMVGYIEYDNSRQEVEF